MKAKINLKNILAFSIGNYRYKLYYSKYFKWLIRPHIYQQIKWRISVMDQKCLANGECLICGCATTALQMANKQCDKPCYPPMVDELHWEQFMRGNIGLWEDNRKFIWTYYYNRTLPYGRELKRINMEEKYKIKHLYGLETK